MKNEFPVLPTHPSIKLECCIPTLAIEIKTNTPVILIKLLTEILLIREDRIAWVQTSYIETFYSVIRQLNKNESITITI
jgi:hypothetical protein